MQRVEALEALGRDHLIAGALELLRGLSYIVSCMLK